MGLDLLSLSAPTPLEASSPSSSPLAGAGAAARGESFGTVVGRLLDAATTTEAGMRAETGNGGAPVEADAAVLPADSIADANDILLALAFPLLTAQAQPVVPLPPEEAAAGAPPAAVDTEDCTNDAAPLASATRIDSASAAAVVTVPGVAVVPAVLPPAAPVSASSGDVPITAAAASHTSAPSAGGEALDSLAARDGHSGRPHGRVSQGQWRVAPPEAGPSVAPGAAALVVDVSGIGSRGVTEPSRAAGSAQPKVAVVLEAEVHGPVKTEAPVATESVVEPEALAAPERVAHVVLTEDIEATPADTAKPSTRPELATAPQRVTVPSMEASPAADGVTTETPGDPRSPVQNAAESRQLTISPQAARLAAFLSQGEVGRIHSIATGAASMAVGRLVAEATPEVRADAHETAAPVRPVDLALPGQAAPSAARDASTKFLGFDTSVAALAADAFQVRGAREAGFGSGDASGHARDRGAYDLRSSTSPAAMADLLDGRTPFMLDGRYTQVTAVPIGGTSGSSMPAGSLPDGTHAAMGEVPTQIVRAMQLQWRDGVGEAKLKLNPESLGEVTITLKVTQGSVTATVKAENPVTMEWIRSHQHELRSALDDQGLRLDQFDVTVNPDGRRQQQDDASQSRPARRPRRGAAGADVPRFELQM